MRPKKLVMSAFGPYAERVEVDFDKFEGRGLVLISGETGAGKTTIFDGISYALYGSVSGSERGVDSLRSDFAKPDTPTFVSLSFEHLGEQYKVERSPRYSRPKKSGEGETINNPAAELTLPHDSLSGSQAVTDKITELLGMNHSQFKQIVMIAQGEFLRLLTEDDDRKETLRKIFDTGFYAILERKLNEQSILLKKELEQAKSRILGAYQEVSYPPEQEESFSDLAQSEHSADDMIRFVEALAQTTQSEYDSKVEEQKKLTKDSTELTAQIQLFAQLNASIKSTKESSEFLSNNAAQIKELTEALAHHKAEEPKRIALATKMNELKNQIESYEGFEQKTAELKKSIEENNTSIEDRNKLTDKHTKQGKLLDEIAEALVKLENIDVQKSEIDHKVEQAQEKGKNLLSTKDDYALCVSDEGELVRLREDFSIKEKQYQAAFSKYNEAEHLFLSEQAGILAETLETGEACPVCGSTEHPHPAAKSATAPSQAELEESKQTLEKLRSSREAASQKASETTARLDAQKSSVLEKLKAQIGEEVEWEKVGELLSAKLSEQNTALAEINKLQKEIHEKSKMRDRLRKEQEQLAEDFESQKNKLEEIKSTISEQEKRIEVLRAEINERKKQLTFNSKAEALSEQEKVKAELAKMQLALKTAEERHSKLNEKMSEARGKLKNEKTRLDSLSAELKLEGAPSEEVNVDELVEKKAKLDTSSANLQESLQELYHRISANEKALEHLTAARKDFLRIESNYNDMSDLANTATGNLSGKIKLTFETYVLQVYFDMVLAEANKRLLSMTDNRYTLVRREDYTSKRSKTGLGLDVVDAWTRKTRSAKTLSGGESFKASLSLALGLSDLVQSFAGGITLETMFIDEGFGSLDGESLEKAMDVIDELAEGNRLVGIISHVDELKERIDNKIIIERDKQGSKIKLETA